MELLLLVCLCLLSCSGDAVRVLVKDGGDAVLPCLISNKDLEGNRFDWKKDGQKEVFMYDAGNHHNNGRPGQDEQFKGRVSHFQDQLKNGNASIKITRTKMADSGNYSCDFPRLQPSQTSIIELVVARIRVLVEEDSDAVLPCLISNKEDITGKLFDWKKDGQKEVFTYATGNHHNNGLPGQDEQFKGRVSHFQDELQNGDASIKITKTKMDDSGIYRCDFPRLEPRQTFIIELVVGVVPEPCIRTLKMTKDQVLLQCEAHGVPRPTLKWEDSDNNTLPAEEPQNSERGGRLYVTVKITVTKTDNYRCVATQETLSHQIFAQTSVYIQGASPKPYVTTLDETQDWSLLQCEVRGASPEPKVEWQDSSGNILPAEEPQVSESGSSFSVILKINVTKTGRYRCVVTQEEINNQTYSETFVQLNEDLSREVEKWRTVSIALGVLAAVLVVAVVCCICKYLQQRTHIISLSDLQQRTHIISLSGDCQQQIRTLQDSENDYDNFDYQ